MIVLVLPPHTFGLIHPARGVVLQTGRFKNSFLNALGAETIDRLHLQPVRFELFHEFEFPGSPIEHLSFVEEGMASMTTTFLDGSQVEVGMFGYESAIGLSALMGTKRSVNRIYTQIVGRGYSCSVDSAKKEFLLGGDLHALVLRYCEAQHVQTAQLAGCNAKHDVQQRLARWLLLCASRADVDSFNLSHEFLADMLGISRPSVSLAAGIFKDEGLIDYGRGQIRILDAARLERRACECYRIIKDQSPNAKNSRSEAFPGLSKGHAPTD
jgi:CRP-like cAMP-binding protein